MAANMWKNSLKNVESDNNKILYETLLDFFLQRNGTYFLNKPRTQYGSYCVSFTTLKQPASIISILIENYENNGKIVAPHPSIRKD